MGLGLMPEFEFAPQLQIEQYDDILIDFIARVVKPIMGIEKVLLTDESSIYDLDAEITEDGIVHHTDEFLKKIKEVYGIDMSDVENLLFIEIFKSLPLKRFRFKKFRTNPNRKRISRKLKKTAYSDAHHVTTQNRKLGS